MTSIPTDPTTTPFLANENKPLTELPEMEFDVRLTQKEMQLIINVVTNYVKMAHKDKITLPLQVTVPLARAFEKMKAVIDAKKHTDIATPSTGE